MRIVAGEFKGRRLVSPSNKSVRPTSDRMRESLFNILASKLGGSLAGASVADLFAGTGALGLEALSRGAAHVTFVDLDPQSIDLVRQNVNLLGVNERTKILKTSATRLPYMDQPCDLLFLDPPYSKGLIAPTLASACQRGWIGHQSLIVIECAQGDLDRPENGFEILDERSQGESSLIFCQKNT